jgi:predicted enzyme related to lactoylglutathione lyase
LLDIFRGVDCVLLRVPDLQAALAFYQDGLGLKLAWKRGSGSAGLKMANGATELVLLEEDGSPETDILVDSVEDAVNRFTKAGGHLVHTPFDIPVGRCAIVKDPWGNPLVLLDLTKGELGAGARDLGSHSSSTDSGR